ncbi:hypothetical protein O166_00190 [Pseudogulbenkiania ferrooxidans EGD-HP2]|uniref:Uncharacterized protein n=1 Tax=Pseudogulbenkiania ferrooxidans EGD-HP2 TaxID=1388764 RepID=A0ABP2XP77_9NEIS|nr:hypothetical protein O166_00190 [Pseudogulbenkiania ferrooxidans EGD-HP2]
MLRLRLRASKFVHVVINMGIVMNKGAITQISRDIGQFQALRKTNTRTSQRFNNRLFRPVSNIAHIIHQPADLKGRIVQVMIKGEFSLFHNGLNAFRSLFAPEALKCGISAS